MCALQAVDESVPMDQIPAWFPDAKLNWAENMLRSRSREKIALIQAGEFRFLSEAIDDCLL
jgi:acetoacetyl-CoA synthetase